MGSPRLHHSCVWATQRQYPGVDVRRTTNDDTKNSTMMQRRLRQGVMAAAGAVGMLQGWSVVRQLSHAEHVLKVPRSSAEQSSSPCSADDHHFQSRGRSRLMLFTREWLAARGVAPLGNVFIVHGLGEHSARYEHVARILSLSGFNVFALDHQGACPLGVPSPRFPLLSLELARWKNSVEPGGREVLCNACGACGVVRVGGLFTAMTAR